MCRYNRGFQTLSNSINSQGSSCTNFYEFIMRYGYGTGLSPAVERAGSFLLPTYLLAFLLIYIFFIIST